MQKGSSSSKIANPSFSPQEQYRSQSSKASTTKTKQPYAFQNMKEFKCEIDHEIAKCLDTLDRQGLKFLKETLRASKIFGLNTQELGLTQPVQENIQAEDSPPKQKEAPKKIEPLKPAVQIKKVVKPEVVKKVQPASKTGKHSQGNLNEKINKKLESLNIKTGKKHDVKPAAKRVEAEVQKAQANHAEIAQQIQVEQVEEKFETLPEEQAKNSEAFTIPYQKNSNGNPIFYESSKQWVKNHSKELKVSPIAEQGSLLKPFCKKQFKKHHEETKHKDHKDYGIQISKEQDFRKAINDAPAKRQEEKVKEPVQEEVVFQNLGIKEKAHEQVHEKIETKEANVGSEAVMTESTDPNIQNLISAIGRLSPGKRSKLERIIEKLQSADNYDSMSSFVSGVTNKDNEVSYHKPYIAQRSFAKNSEVKDNHSNHSKSRTKMEKVEKATSLKSSLIKKINQSLTPQSHGNLTPGIKKKQEATLINTEKASQDNILSMYDDAKSQMISVQARGEKKVNNLLQEVKQKKEEPPNSLKQSNTFSNASETGQKLIKIGKKKLQVTSITFKIISNGGHNSLVGLTSIHLYNLTGDVITIDETNLKSSNTKLLKLFDSTKNQGWLTSLSNATISLDNISQTIGGIRIVNWNKSQLEVDRQADLMEIWINDQLHWRGQVRGGSYKENQVYATNIKVTEKHFEFPTNRREEIVPIEERSPKKLNPSQKDVKITLDEPEKDRPESCWLEKQSVQLKLRQIQEQQKREEKVKKIGSIRNTTVIGSSLNIDKIMPTEPVLDARPFDFGPNWQRQQKREEMRYETEPKSALRSQVNDDILLELSRGVDARRKKQEQSSNKKKEELSIKHKEQSLSKKQQQQDYLVQKEKEQDEEFEKILQSMEQRSKPKECIKVSTPKRIEQEKPVENKLKLIAEKDFEDFMKDSLFDDKPIQRRFQNKPIRQEKQAEEPRRELNPKTPKGSNTKQLDNLIDELNGIVGEAGEETGEQFCIPELPRGKEISLVMLSNWGHQSFIGLNGIELFDSDGQLVKPVGVACSLVSSKQLYEKLFKAQLLTSDQKAQLKFQRGKRVSISLTLAERTELAAIRVWNYNGHRVHSNIGVRKLHIKFDGSFIFSGEIQQSSGTSEDAYKFCEYILFTENNNIMSKIAQGDWLNRINRRQEEERALFKTTLENFHRPLTRNDQEAVKRQPQEMPIQKQPVRLPKRICFEYDPPQLPEGFVIRLAIHSSWGDRFFIGLNFLEVFNDKGQNITTRNLVQVRADPSSVSKLPGYEGDRRVPANLTKGRSTAQSTWLAPLLSDVERIEKGRPNIVLLEYSKPSKIAAINFYNYTKTPARGVRQVQVFLDDSLLYRGYLRKADSQSGALHTTICFTRDPSLLQAVNYSGYNEDHLEQEVALVNEERIIKAGSAFDANLIRPMTGKLLA